MKTLAFFNNKGGVGKTSLTFHLTWMFAELGFSRPVREPQIQIRYSPSAIGGKTTGSERSYDFIAERLCRLLFSLAANYQPNFRRTFIGSSRWPSGRNLCAK